MKAAYIEQVGSTDRIVFGSLPKPKVDEGQLLVKVEAVSVNPIDAYIRSGAVKMELPLPYILGCDLAGVVEAVGPGVTRFKEGDRVWGSNQGLLGRQGTFSEFAVVDEQWLYPTPDEATSQDAAALALVGITAHLGLFRHGNLKMGEKVFIHGGTGGVGSCAVQMAKAVGAFVVSSASSRDKATIVKGLGANVVVNYRSEDLATVLKKHGPFDLWLETLREPNFDLMIDNLAMNGRAIVIAGRDARPQFPLGPFYTKNLVLRGFAMFNTPADEQRKSAAEINRWHARGKLRPLVDRMLPLSEAAAAQKLQEENTIRHSGTLCGKIVLTP